LLLLSANSLCREWARPPTENGIAHTPAGILFLYLPGMNV